MSKHGSNYNETRESHQPSKSNEDLIEQYAQSIQDMYFLAGAKVSVETWNNTKDFIRNAITTAKDAEREKAVEEERIRLVKTGKLWVEVQEDNVSIRKVNLFDLTPTKTDKQTEV